jgi:leucyl-tRNA synthetase
VSREALASDVRTLVVQVNGKVRGQVEVPSEASEEVIRNAALSDPKVARALEGKSVAQVIHVPGRLVSIVAR